MRTALELAVDPGRGFDPFLGRHACLTRAVGPLRARCWPGRSSPWHCEQQRDAIWNRKWHQRLDDGGAYSTVGDFAAFWPALFAGRIVSRPLVDEMIRPRNDALSESKRYGLGFWIQGDRATVMLEGYDAGVSFRSAYDPESELLYTVVSNTSAGAWPLVDLLDELLSDLART